MNECQPLVEIYFHEFVHEVVFLRWLYSKDLYEESLGKQIKFSLGTIHQVVLVLSSKRDNRVFG